MCFKVVLVRHADDPRSDEQLIALHRRLERVVFLKKQIRHCRRVVQYHLDRIEYRRRVREYLADHEILHSQRRQPILACPPTPPPAEEDVVYTIVNAPPPEEPPQPEEPEDPDDSEWLDAWDPKWQTPPAAAQHLMQPRNALVFDSK